jgi:hypothetical protein
MRHVDLCKVPSPAQAPLLSTIAPITTFDLIQRRIVTSIAVLLRILRVGLLVGLTAHRIQLDQLRVPKCRLLLPWMTLSCGLYGPRTSQHMSFRVVITLTTLYLGSVSFTGPDTGFTVSQPLYVNL